MTRVKSQAWAVVAAASLLSSTIGLGAAERPPLKDSIASAAKVLAVQSSRPLPAAAARRDGAAQDPVPSVRARPSCGCGVPSWVKYTLIGAAAAGGGYAASQIGHHGGHGGRGGPDTDATGK